MCAERCVLTFLRESGFVLVLPEYQPPRVEEYRFMVRAAGWRVPSTDWGVSEANVVVPC